MLPAVFRVPSAHFPTACDRPNDVKQRGQQPSQSHASNRSKSDMDDLSSHIRYVGSEGTNVQSVFTQSFRNPGGYGRRSCDDSVPRNER